MVVARARERYARNQRAFRARNRAAGLCSCGKPRRVTVDGRPSKLCDHCATKLRTAFPSAAERVVAVPARRVWVRLTVDCEPALVLEWQAFAEAWSMSLGQVVEEAMELYVAVTRAHEAEADVGLPAALEAER